jgi:acyl-CoA reductase-like NAD-dependent aldehyde dehydrogenase
MRIANEEIFGPVLTVSTFEDEDEAIDLANDVDYGLVAGVFTAEYERANRVARAIDAGQVYVNDWFAGGVETPFGGYKASGIGREKGVQAVREYTQLKTINSRTFRRD